MKIAIMCFAHKYAIKIVFKLFHEIPRGFVRLLSISLKLVYILVYVSDNFINIRKIVSDMLMKIAIMCFAHKYAIKIVFKLLYEIARGFVRL